MTLNSTEKIIIPMNVGFMLTHCQQIHNGDNNMDPFINSVSYTKDCLKT